MADVTHERKQAVEQATMFLMPILRDRMTRGTGVPWCCGEDTAEIAKRFGIPTGSFKTIWHFARTELEVTEIERRNSREKGEQISTLYELLKDTSGEITDDVMQLFQERHPDARPSSGVTREARKRLGLAGPVKTKTAPLPPVEGLEEASRYFNEYQALLAREHELEIELADIKKKKDKFRGIANALNALRNAVHNAKEETRKEVGADLDRSFTDA